MNKRIAGIIVSGVLALSVLPAVALAHSGRTDSSGGHWNHSTGEYHYHHGYSAHQHYDIDGDGVADCPYDFVDVSTSSSSSGSYSSGYADGKSDGYNSGYSAGKADAEQVAKTEIARLKEESEADIESARKQASSKAWGMAFWFGIPVVAFVTGKILSKSHDREIDGYTTEINRLKKELNDTKNSSVLQASRPGSALPPGIPTDVSLNLSCTPVKGSATSNRPFGEYTVYITKSGKKYHCKYQCCGAKTPVHLFQLPKGLLPCSNCVPVHIRNAQVPDWYLQIINPKRVSAPPVAKPTPVLPPKPAVTEKPKDTKPFFTYIGYNDTVLILRFASGKEYHYFDVPKWVYDDLLKSSDQESYYTHSIAWKYSKF